MSDKARDVLSVLRAYTPDNHRNITINEAIKSAVDIIESQQREIDRLLTLINDTETELYAAGYPDGALILDSVKHIIGERDRLRERQSSLFDAIKHGDDDHQSWLKEAIEKHFNSTTARGE